LDLRSLWKASPNLFKLSQNKTDEEQQNIIEKLEYRGDYNLVMIAGEMWARMN